MKYRNHIASVDQLYFAQNFHVLYVLIHIVLIVFYQNFLKKIVSRKISIVAFTLQLLHKLIQSSCNFYSNPYGGRPPSRRGNREGNNNRGDIKSRLWSSSTNRSSNNQDWYKVVVSFLYL